MTRPNWASGNAGESCKHGVRYCEDCAACERVMVTDDEVGLLSESVADGGGLGLIRRHPDLAAPRRVVEIQTDMVEQGEQLASVSVNGVTYYPRDAGGV